MNTSIQNVSVSHKSSITKIAEGALLIRGVSCERHHFLYCTVVHLER